MIVERLDEGNVEIHEQPVGTRCAFRWSDHRYAAEAIQNGSKITLKERITGCSTPGKVFDLSTDPLIDWGSRLSTEGAAEIIEQIVESTDDDQLADALSWFTPERIWAELKEQKATWRDRREKRGDEGSEAHAYLVELARGNEPEPRTGYERGVLAFWNALINPQVLQCEEVVYSPEHGFAGRFDLRVNVGDQVWLCDLKTSGFISSAFHAQLAGYDLAARESGYGSSDRLLIVKVDAEGGFELIDAEADHSDFLCALDAHRRAAKISAAARKSRKAREVAAA